MSKKEKIIKKESSANPTPAKHKTEQLIAFVVLAYFINYFFIIELFKILELKLLNLFRLLALTVGISFFIPIRVYRKKIRLSYYEYIIYNLICVGPLFLLLILSLNIGFSSKNYTETYSIVSINKIDEYSGHVLTLENDAYEDKLYLREIKATENIGNISTAKKIEYKFSDGLFGIRIIKDKTLKP